MELPQIDRRQLLKGAGAGAIGTLLLHGAATGVEDLPPPLVGTVAEASSDFLHVDAPGGRTRVEVTEGALVWRDRFVGLDEFHVGDLVAADGAMSDETFLANQVQIVGQLLEGRIEERDSDQLVLADREVALTKETTPSSEHGAKAKELHRLEVGDTVVVAGRSEPSNGELIAWTVGVRA
jgi:hypothetical protein